MTCYIWHAFCGIKMAKNNRKMNAKHKQCYDTQV